MIPLPPLLFLSAVAIDSPSSIAVAYGLTAIS
jgi:hypothetical protein